jgi:hypothetical protein
MVPYTALMPCFERRFRESRRRVERRWHAPWTGIGLRETNEVGALGFGAGDKIDRVADVFLSLLDRVNNRLHHGNAECHVLLQRRCEFGGKLEMARRGGQASA